MSTTRLFDVASRAVLEAPRPCDCGYRGSCHQAIRDAAKRTRASKTPSMEEGGICTEVGVWSAFSMDHLHAAWLHDDPQGSVVALWRRGGRVGRIIGIKGIKGIKGRTFGRFLSLFYVLSIFGRMIGAALGSPGAQY